MNATRVLVLSGTWGALLTVVILAMSVLLRLGTQLDGGVAVTQLPQGVELWARMAHRIAAMGVGILAALALVAAWQGKAAGRTRATVAAVVAITLALAVAGRYTPGYRVDLVTVLNVAGGMALAAAFWALRRGEAGSELDGVALAALALLVVLAGLGAAGDAAAMRGTRAFGPLHLWIAAFFVCLALAAAWRQRTRRAVAAAVAVLIAAQLVVGFVLLASRGDRPLALGWAHAMLACALALGVATLCTRGGRRQ
jgi:heme A synthase